MSKSRDVLESKQIELQNEAQIRAKEFVNKTMSAGFGGRDTETGFTSDYLPSRGKSNLGLNLDLISGKKSGFEGVMPDFKPQGSANVGLDKSNILGNIGLVDKARQNVQGQAQGLIDSLNVRKPGFLNTPAADYISNPKEAITNKVVDSLGIAKPNFLKPNFLTGLGPMGWLGQMALGTLGQKVFKPHTVVGKLFKGLFG